MLPVFLRLAGKACLVVGGGPVGYRKVRLLLQEGARVTLVSPAAVPELKELAAQGKIAWLRRSFVPEDVRGMTLIFAAADDRAVNKAVVEVARRSGIWTNAADDPENCDFYLGGVARSGPVVVGVSTSGNSPALASYLRKRLQAELGPGLAIVAELLGAYRDRVNREIPDERRRASFWRRAVEKLVPIGQSGKGRKELNGEFERLLLQAGGKERSP